MKVLGLIFRLHLRPRFDRNDINLTRSHVTKRHFRLVPLIPARLTLGHDSLTLSSASGGSLSTWAVTQRTSLIGPIGAHLPFQAIQHVIIIPGAVTYRGLEAEAVLGQFLVSLTHNLYIQFFTEFPHWGDHSQPCAPEQGNI